MNLAVQHAENGDTLVPALEDLSRRHVGYGVTDEHYDAVGAALIWTLEQGLADAFTDEARSIWVSAYGLVSQTMQRAAGEVVSDAA